MLSLHDCLRTVNIGIIHTSRQDIHSLVKFQAVILKACLCLLNRRPQNPQRPLDHLCQLAIQIRTLAVINDVTEEGNGRQASLAAAMASCLLYQTFLITVNSTP